MGPSSLLGVPAGMHAYTYVHISYVRFHMSIFGTTPPSQEGGVDSFGLFACILSHYMYLLMCSSSSRYIFILCDVTRMHTYMALIVCMLVGIHFSRVL